MPVCIISPPELINPTQKGNVASGFGQETVGVVKVAQIDQFPDIVGAAEYPI